jgi:hypothetical protein
VAATIHRWQPWIVNFFRDRVTNGVTEGINTKIKLLKRLAYGLPDFAHIRARILLAFSPEVTSPQAQTLSKSQIFHQRAEVPGVPFVVVLKPDERCLRLQCSSVMAISRLCPSKNRDDWVRESQ